MLVKLNGNDFFRVTCPYGSTDPLHPLGHKGLDLAMNIGTPLYSPTDGFIERVVDYGNTNIGKGIIIRTEGNECLILGHMSDTTPVEVGQKISYGDYLGLSGSTGRSTGGHLHLGLKDSSGSFIDPKDYVVDEKELSAIQKFFENGRIVDDGKYGEGLLGKVLNENGVIPRADGQKGFIESLIELQDFSQRVKEDGFFRALYGKSFFEVTKDFLTELAKDTFEFIVSNADLFFVIPAIIFMFMTFFIGRNKYTKFVLPLWLSYFVAIILNATFFE